jgi:hypothetical protein
VGSKFKRESARAHTHIHTHTHTQLSHKANFLALTKKSRLGKIFKSCHIWSDKVCNVLHGIIVNIDSSYLSSPEKSFMYWMFLSGFNKCNLWNESYFDRPCTCGCGGSWFTAANWDNQELYIDRQHGLGSDTSCSWPHRWTVGSSCSPKFATVCHSRSWSLGHAVGFNEPLSGVEQGCCSKFAKWTLH